MNEIISTQNSKIDVSTMVKVYRYYKFRRWYGCGKKINCYKMMNKLIKILILVIGTLSTSVSYAQMHDNVWTFGYTCIPGDSSRFGGTNLYFTDGEIEGKYFCRDIRFGGNTTASFSDKEGNLQLMFNGCTLNDGNNELVEGSEILVRNDTNLEQTWWCLDGYNTPNSTVFLPNPSNDGSVYLFYRDVIAIDDFPFYISDSFYVAKIEFENEVPFVSDKYAVIADTIIINGMSAAKHANGNDWWVMIKNRNDNIYHKLLVDSEGVRLHSNQEVGIFETTENNGNTIKIDRNGRYMASFDPFTSLEILEFDRTTGILSEHISIPSWVDLFNNKVLDIEFSPSGDYLYVAETDTLWQFDMTVAPEDFFISKTTVGIRDAFIDPFPTNFWLMQVAPDGKIYMSARNSSQYLHVIHAPNEKGMACDFRNNDYKLPTVNSFSMPYFPNYRLGADSTYVGIEELDADVLVNVTIYPNPASYEVRVSANIEIDKIEIFSLDGKLIKSTESHNSVDVSNMRPGLYFINCYHRSKLVAREKFVKM